MKSYKTKQFHNASKHIDRENLQQILDDFISLDDDGRNRYSLGSNLFKIRVATNNKGKSGGSRTIIVFKKGHVCYWVHCFEKKTQDNIDPKQLKILKGQSDKLLSLTENEIDKLIDKKILYEV